LLPLILAVLHVTGDWLSTELWWQYSMAVNVIYICLVAVTVVLLLTLITVIVICCQCCDVRRALKKDTDL